MKNRIYKSIIASLSLVLIINTSCEDFVNGVDEFNPTLPRDASLGQVLTSAEVGIIAFNEGDLARIAGIFTDQFTGVDRQYVSLQEYTTTAGDYDSQWGNMYALALKSLRIAQRKASELNNGRTLGKAKILEAYLMGMTAALFGDVPYSQAANFVEFPNPIYDSQTEVYADVLALLDNAIADINGAVAGTAYEGLIFGGNDAVWLARANTLKAKYNLHLGNYAAAASAAAIGVTSTASELLAPHGPSYNQDFNIYYSFLSYDRPGYMSADGALAPKLLDPGYVNGTLSRDNGKTQEAARFMTFYYPAGLNTGVEEYDINVLWSSDWGSSPEEDGAFSAIASMPIISFAENQLILAEALVRTGDDAGAITALNAWRTALAGGYRISQGYLVEGSDYQTYVLADFADGGIENTDGLDDSDALYREIIEEKYVSLIGQLEVFNDARRMGFGSFSAQQNWQVLGITPNTGAQIPQRFLIPQTELNSNTSAPSDPPGLFERTEIF